MRILFILFIVVFCGQCSSELYSAVEDLEELVIIEGKLIEQWEWFIMEMESKLELTKKFVGL